jgi:hypothetical protein
VLKTLRFPLTAIARLDISDHYDACHGFSAQNVIARTNVILDGGISGLVLFHLF